MKPTEHDHSRGESLRKGVPERDDKKQPPQQQTSPGEESKMTPEPIVEDERYRGSNKLLDKVALITGADSGIGRATAILYAKEGADVAIMYLNEHKDAEDTAARVRALGRRAICIAGDVGDESFCRESVERVVREFGKLDILVNNAAEHTATEDIEEITAEQMEKTFRTNLFGYFYMAKAAVKHLGKGSSIINTASVQAYDPSPQILDYALTKGAIVTLTRVLAKQHAEHGIRVNAVAPGPVWTPLIASTYSPEKVAKFGRDNPMGRPAQPSELAPSFVFLASDVDSSFMSGQVLHVNGGSAMHS